MTEKNSTAKVSPKDVAAMAAEEKLVVPAQAEGEPKTTAETPELKLVEGGKKSLKERLSALTEKVKANKKAFIAVGAAAGVATVAFVKYAQKKAQEAALDESESVADTEVVSSESAA